MLLGLGGPRKIILPPLTFVIATWNSDWPFKTQTEMGYCITDSES